jgi:hypothetical protein
MLTQSQDSQIARLARMGLNRKNIIGIMNIKCHDTIDKRWKLKKRVVAISDLHCGSRIGLTPPRWQYQEGNTEAAKWGKQQKETWDYFAETLRLLQPIDVLLVVGDAIDGKGARSGGTEAITTDIKSQVDMAVECISEAKANSIVMVRGTPYHTGEADDYEDFIRERLQGVTKGPVVLGNHEFPIINGITFDIKHHAGSSSVPHGRNTALLRSRVWSVLWAEREQQPRSHIIIRGHTHYHTFCGDGRFLAMTLPALQGWGSKYGSKMCEGTVDTGLVWFDIPYNSKDIQDVTWHSDLPKLANQKVETYNL